MIGNVENISQNIAMKLGFSYVPWFTLTKVVLGIYSILTCFVLFFRSDFLNLTICTTAIYMILNTEKIQRWTFRLLVIGIFISLIVDLMFFMAQDYKGDQSDGGLQKGVQGFSLTMSYFSFFFRVSSRSFLISCSIDYCSLCLLEGFIGLHQNY